MAFVDNARFYQLMIEYDRLKNDKKSLEFKTVHNEIGKIFDIMAKKLLYSPKFSNYSPNWKDEMYSEAVFNCCRYMHNFDVVNNKNPFAYFTRVIWNSFLQMINKEKRINSHRDIVVDKIWSDITSVVSELQFLEVSKIQLEESGQESCIQ